MHASRTAQSAADALTNQVGLLSQNVSLSVACKHQLQYAATLQLQAADCVLESLDSPKSYLASSLS